MPGSERRRVHITGAAGFLGSHLVDRFLDAGWQVPGVDNLMGGSARNLSRARTHPAFRFVVADVITPYEASADLIVNLACLASPQRYQANPLHTMKTSVLGMFNACEAARRCGARLIHSSTSEVYGEPKVHPQPESYRGAVNPIGRRGCYDEGKRAAETILFDHHRLYGLNIGLCRIFNTYGPPDGPLRWPRGVQFRAASPDGRTADDLWHRAADTIAVLCR